MNLPLEVHDTAYLDVPVAAAVSRVTLHPWCENAPPDEVFLPRGRPLARCMQNAMSLVRQSAPDFRHGLLVHAVKKSPDGCPEAPSLHTVKQYAFLQTTLFCVPLDVPDTSLGRDYTVLVHLDDKHRVPKWVWQRLASELLYPSRTVGEPPPLTSP